VTDGVGVAAGVEAGVAPIITPPASPLPFFPVELAAGAGVAAGAGAAAGVAVEDFVVVDFVLVVEVLLVAALPVEALLVVVVVFFVWASTVSAEDAVSTSVSAVAVIERMFIISIEKWERRSIELKKENGVQRVSLLHTE
jgi:hypothetical protein